MNESAPEGQMAVGPRKSAVALYVVRSREQWIVRDPEGNFWIIQPGKDSWEQRLPFELTDETELESVPGNYKYMLGLPF